MSNLNVSVGEAKIIRNVVRDYVGNVRGNKSQDFTRRGQRGHGEDISGYDGPFVTIAELYIADNDQEKLKINTERGTAVGGTTTFSFDRFNSDLELSEYNAQTVDKEQFNDDSLTDNDTIYQLEVIAEMWWPINTDENNPNDNDITVTPTEITQNRGDPGGTAVGDNIQDNQPEGAYYARYPIATLFYKKTVVDSVTTYSIYQLIQNQYGSILIASRYV